MGNGVIIELQNISKKYDDEIILDNINLSIKDKEFMTFLGPSGCGKTTTLRIIAGFLEADNGQVIFEGKDINNLPPHKRQVNTIFQRYALFPHLNVYDNIAFGLRVKKMKEKDISKKVKEMLELVNLRGFQKRNIASLSGGQQQRVAIARALAVEPRVLLLDEPLGALDLKLRKDMQVELKNIQKRMGITFIYVTHDQQEALSMSDTVVVMNDGKIQQIGSPIDIYNEPKNAFVADFIGESNIYSGTVVGDKKVRFINKVFDCVDEFEINEKVDVVVRPEDVKIVKEEKGKVSGVISSCIFKGVHYQMTMMVGRSEVVIQSTKGYEVGTKVSIDIAPQDIHIMHKEFVSNVYDGYITKDNKVWFADGEFECDVTQLYEGSHLDDEGYLITQDGEQIDLNGVDVKVEVGLKDIEIIDNDTDGDACGSIISIVYKGDHYQIIIRTDDEEEDFVCDTEYVWNENDRVSVKIPKDKIKLKLKTEDKK